MKPSILIVSAFALLAAPTFIFAEDASPAEKRPGSAQPGGRRGSLGTPEERIKMMAEQLGLSQDQQDKIKAIFAKNADALKLIREKGYQNLSDDEKTKLREGMKTQQDEVAAILTPDQKAKLEKARAERWNRRPGGEKPSGNKPSTEKPAVTTPQ
jgi:Spy/CpxP family protein refolding chaperone